MAWAKISDLILNLNSAYFSNTTYMNLKELIDITVTPYLPQSLIDKKAIQRINSIAQDLPEQITSFFGFECRLGNKKPVADFLFCIFKDSYGHDILNNSDNQNSLLPQKWMNHSIWKNIIRFVKKWDENMDHLWLEFDIQENEGESIPIPSFFFAPIDSTNGIFLRREESFKTIIKGLLIVKAGKIEELIQKQIYNVVMTLPDDAYIFQVGTMLSRSEQVYRLCIRDIEGPQIVSFLAKMNWIGNLGILSELINELYTYVDRIDLDVDINTQIGPKIGLECYLNMDDQRSHRWKHFLSYLADRGLCTDEKEEALVGLEGYVHQGECEQYPEHLIQMLGFIGSKYMSVYLRDIHHIKIDFLDSSILEAKAYLRVKHIWVSRSNLFEAAKQSQLTKVQEQYDNI